MFQQQGIARADFERLAFPNTPLDLLVAIRVATNLRV